MILQRGAKLVGSSVSRGRWIPVARKGDWLRADSRLEISGNFNAKVPVPFSCGPLGGGVKNRSVSVSTCEPLEESIDRWSVDKRGQALRRLYFIPGFASADTQSPSPFINYLALLLIIFTSVTPTAIAEDVVVSSVVLRLLDEAEAPARVAGVVVAVNAQEGDQVKRGDLLAQLDDAEAKLAVTAAKIDAAIARQAAENDTPIRYAAKAAEAARAELQRSTDSIAKFPKSVSQSQMDVERLTIEKAMLEKESAEETQKQAQLEYRLRRSRLDAAKLELSRRQIVASLDGVVVETLVRPGEWLQPGQKAFRIVRTDRLKAEGFVLAKEARGDLIGKSVAIAGSPSKNLQGHVVFVSPEVDPITNQVRVWAEIDNRDGTWHPGDRVEMTIVEATP